MGRQRSRRLRLIVSRSVIGVSRFHSSASPVFAHLGLDDIGEDLARPGCIQPDVGADSGLHAAVTKQLVEQARTRPAAV